MLCLNHSILLFSVNGTDFRANAFFGIFTYKQEFGTVEPEMLKEASKRMPTGKNSHIHKVFTNFGVDIS